MSVLYDESEWESPYTFHPARFMDKDGKFVNRDAFMPFSAGRRICLGESLARMELFVFFTTLLQHFRFSEDQLDLTPQVCLTLEPLPHKLCAVPRMATGSRTVKLLYTDKDTFYFYLMGMLDLFLQSSSSVSLLGALVVLLFIYLISSSSFSSQGDGKDPPGPKPLPLLGNFLQLDLKRPYNTLLELSKKYGSVFTIYLGPKKVVVLAGYKTVKEALVNHAEEFGERDPIPLVHEITKGHGVLWSNGDSWKETRRFALTNLRDFGMGKKACEDKIIEECDYLIEVFKKFKGEAFDTAQPINYAVSNIICSMVYGSRFEYDDPEFTSLVDRTNRNIQLVGSPSIQVYNLFPWLGKLIGDRREILKSIAANKEQNLRLFRRLRETLNPQMCRGFVDAFLVRKQNLEESGITDSHFNNENLMVTVLNLFAAGTDTTATTLRWGLLFMAKYPKIQETQRLANIVPMALPHRTSQDVTFQGHFIKKGTTVYPLLTSVLYDESEWENPHKFYPAHFLDKDGKFVKREMPSCLFLQVGRRICLGESLARMELFVFFTTLLQHFRFTSPPGVSEDELDLTPRVGFTLNPSPHKLCAISCLAVQSLKETLNPQMCRGFVDAFRNHRVSGKTHTPAHFLDKDGKFVNQDAFMPFSAGRRICLGESLARMELFIFFTTLLQHFHFTPPRAVSEDELDLTPQVCLTLEPLPHTLCAVPSKVSAVQAVDARRQPPNPVVDTGIDRYWQAASKPQQLPGRSWRQKTRVRDDLTWVLEGSWEFAQPVIMCFVDLEKAFDRVPCGIMGMGSGEAAHEYGEAAGRISTSTSEAMVHMAKGGLPSPALVERSCLREVFQACPTGRRPQGRPRTCWRDYVSQLAWEHLGIPLEELEEVSGSSSSVSLLGALVVLLFIYLISSSSFSSQGDGKDPPGPKPLPLLGNFLQLDLKRPYNTLLELSKKYGSVFTIYLGPKKVVVLAGYKTVKEALVNHAEEFGERDPIPLVNEITKGHGVLWSNGDLWKETRRFALTNLRDFGMGKKACEDKISEECDYLIEVFKKFKGLAFDTAQPINYAVSNIICSMVYGSRFEYDDPEFTSLVDRTNRFIQLVGSPSIQVYNLFPWLGKLIGDRSEILNSIADNKEQNLRLFSRLRETLNPQMCRGFVDAFLVRKQNLEESGITDSHFNNENLMVTVLNLFAAGTDTTATTLRWGLLLYGQISKDTSLELGTTVYPLLTSVLYDESEWENPHKFYPAHFLDKDGKFVKQDAFMPFSAGRRICLGESLARMELFVFFTTLLQHFRFTPPPGVSENELDLTPRVGFTLNPSPHELCAVSCLPAAVSSVLVRLPPGLGPHRRSLLQHPTGRPRSPSAQVGGARLPSEERDQCIRAVPMFGALDVLLLVYLVSYISFSTQEARKEPPRPKPLPLLGNLLQLDLKKISLLEESGIPNSHFHNENLLMSVINLFIAGTDKTATTLRWGLLFMAKYPKVEDLVQEELKRVIGSRQVQVEDRKNLPFTNAVIHETQRLASIAPVALPHKTTKDVTFQGHFIKKHFHYTPPPGVSEDELDLTPQLRLTFNPPPHKCSSSVSLLGALVVSLLIYLLSSSFSSQENRKDPPGPKPLPLLGNLLQLDLKRPYNTLLEFSKKYGSVFTVYLGPKKVVVLAGYKTVKEALVNHAEEFGERDPLLIVQETSQGHGVLWTNGESWKEMRRFALTNLRDFGMGKKACEDKIIEECHYVIEVFKTFKGKREAFDTARPIFYAVSNIICSMVYGSRFEYDDPEFTSLVDRINRNIQLVGSPSVQESNITNNHFHNENLMMTVIHLFAAATDTTAITLTWALLFMVKYPRIQDQVQEELKRVMGSRQVQVEDRKNLPFTNAVIHETQRLANILPMSLPHKTSQDVNFKGYFIKKGTTVYPLLMSVLYDESEWESPHTFNPAHFLDKDGKFVKRDAFMPFSAQVGRRICLGESLARMELFIFFTTLLQHFRFTPPPGVSEDELDLTPRVGFTLSPFPHNLCAVSIKVMGVFKLILQSFSSTSSLFGVLLVLLLVYFVSSSSFSSQKDRKDPPGPKPLPLLGNLLQLDLKRPYNTLLEFSKKYGSVFTVYLGPKKVVVLAGYKTVKEALVNHAEEFGERDPMLILQETSQGHGVLWTNGESWKEMRRFALTNLRDFGMGKKACEDKIIEECHYVIEVFKTFKGKREAFDTARPIFYAVSNIICSMVYGSRFEYDDPQFTSLVDRINRNIQLVGSPSVQESNITNNHFHNENLMMTVIHLFAAATDTTAITLTWALLFMVKYPRIQDQVQEELKRVMGSRQVQVEDRKNLPFTNAVIHETQRLANILPMSLPHKTSQDVNFKGYFIKKGTTVYPLLMSVLYDESEWESPHTFNPAHFLDKDGKFVKRDAFMPFSAQVGEFIHHFLMLTCLQMTSTFSFLVTRSFSSQKDGKDPPGPKPLPLLGNLLQMDLKRPYNTLMTLSKKYGSVFTVYFGYQKVVVLAGYKTVKEALVNYADEFGERDMLLIVDEFNQGHGVIWSNGDSWKEMRRFALTNLRDFGMGKKACEDKIIEECDYLIEVFKKFKGEAFDTSQPINYAVSNIICSIVYGSRFEYDNPKFTSMVDQTNKRIQLVGSPLVQIYNLFPWIGKWLSDKKEIVKITDFITKQNLVLFKHLKETLNPQMCRGFVDAFLIQKQNLEESGVTNSYFHDENLMMTVLNLFTAGTDTTATTLRWGLLLMVKYPKIQDQVQKELSRVIGGRQVQMEDRKNLPFTDAVIHETQRLANIVPMAAPHRTSQDITFQGHFIKKGTTVYPLLMSVLYDERVTGRRICLGENLARMELFIFFTTLLQHFRFTPPPGVSEDELDLTPRVGFTLNPLPHKLCAISCM
ncbi:hypothetical protein L3Q82_011375 [Scortum barcoo]|uniref:Uncharacterized protein n=1 Tax=Scortum barcoo TaxID=214431 RepID=A0ACB8WAA5_9TELE|nr:hypothetical protein L3Q82_011375 [Scortum barcoo]